MRSLVFHVNYGLSFLLFCGRTHTGAIFFPPVGQSTKGYGPVIDEKMANQLASKRKMG